LGSRVRREGLLRIMAGAGVALAWAASSFAGTTGRITGRVTDPKHQPLEAVSVAIPALRLGAYTDAEGRFSIANVPAGTYELRVNLLGYSPTTVQNVLVTSDQTATLDVSLGEAPIAVKEVVITAKRPVVDVNQTSSVATVSRQEIEKLPVQQLNDLVALQAGVVSQGSELHVRGGRSDEVQYQVDGVSVNNLYDNQSMLKLDRSVLEEVQVITGTFDAEYGQAMSGVVNAVLRRGGDRFQWNGEAMLGAWAAPGATERLDVPQAFPGDVQNFQFTASGPLPVARTTYLANIRYGDIEDWVRGERRFTPAKDTTLTGTKYLTPDGDFSRFSLGYTREWTGLVKLSTRPSPRYELGYQAVGDMLDASRNTWAFRFDPNGLSRQHTFSVSQGADFTMTPTSKSFYNLTGRLNTFRYRDMVYDDFNDPRYDAAGGPQANQNYENGAIYAGVDLTRFEQNTDALEFKTSYVNESHSNNRYKVGGEFQWPSIQFGHPGWLTYSTVGSGGQVLVRHDNDPPNFPGSSTYYPIMGAGYAQDDIEWQQIRVRAGLRYDMFDARTTLPSDLSNPANSIPGSPVSYPVRTSIKNTISPRIGVSYPITPGLSLYFAYGHFYQMPKLGDIFSNSDYSVLNDLQSTIVYTVMGNPDVRPQRTVQYQFGYKQAINENLGVDVNAFYKDIRDLLGVEFISTYNDAEYPRFTNVDYGSVVGFTISADDRALGPVSLSMDYTWQIAQGNSSDPRETATRASAGLDPRPQQIPFDWDQRNTFNLTATVSNPKRYTVSSVLRMASGQPYTPSTSVGGLGLGFETNEGRKPFSWLMDLRGESYVQLGGLPMTAFLRIFNVFDARFFNGFVFDSSGNVDSSSNPSDVAQEGDPTRFYPPRRLEFGLTVRGGS